MPADTAQRRSIWCCACASDVQARLTDGREIYPRRPDLAELPFWRCDRCRNSVGCHHKTRDRTRPLGVIATPELKQARQHIHSILDPLWRSGRWKRGQLYAALTEKLGRQYHTSELRSLEEAREVWRAIRELEKRA